jgi:hypothetical protein
MIEGGVMTHTYHNRGSVMDISIYKVNAIQHVQFILHRILYNEVRAKVCPELLSRIELQAHSELEDCAMKEIIPSHLWLEDSKITAKVREGRPTIVDITLPKWLQDWLEPC